MKTTWAKISDVYNIIQDLSDQNRAEHVAMGLTEWQVLKDAAAWVKEWPTVTGWIDDKPAFVFGVLGVEQKLTWFLGTKAYFKSGAVGVLGARRILRQAKEKHGPLLTISQSLHPDVDRWFTLLGFEKIEDNGQRRVFRYA